MNVFEVGTKLTIKNLEFSFHSLSAFTCSPGSVEHTFHFHPGLERNGLFAVSQSSSLRTLFASLSPSPQKLAVTLQNRSSAASHY